MGITDFDGDRLSERKYERLCTMIFSCIPSSLLMFDRNLRVVIANKNFLEKSRRTEEDTIGRHVDDIFPLLYCNTPGLPKGCRRSLERACETAGRKCTIGHQAFLPGFISIA